ncbi:DTW domain-containing protein 1 [Harpegnathos saltator]|uniref:tRNA-uridine aminocarboxypropyltransferase 1 n=1 Tax=Harpegnathos saltator TaxID=610380 RepID=E2B7W0_HARSA|nr:DTW domain-containing protein 1 [Harpegnathos saltator]XP_025154617.1 DTW domain-containing protein 1 [Harpegnathos saltator]EFN88253.1 DTW domain-containing protein 1 [Harpegnathos saltator]
MAECTVYELSELERKQKTIDRAPFRNLSINNTTILDTIEGRMPCERCYASRKYFCYHCYLPVIDQVYFPRVKLPIKIDIVKHHREIAGKSTAIHAVILAPEDVKIYTYPQIPEILDKEKTVLIFPSKIAIGVKDLFKKEEAEDERGQNSTTVKKIKNMLPIRRAIFIDSTWQQTKEIYKDARLRELRCVILKSRISQFWRNQKNCPRWYLATIEAIHQFLVELHTCAFGIIENYADLDDSTVNREESFIIPNEEYLETYLATDLRYNGQYDNLLYFFKYMYNKIHTIYDHDKLLAYKRPLL